MRVLDIILHEYLLFCRGCSICSPWVESVEVEVGLALGGTPILDPPVFDSDF